MRKFFALALAVAMVLSLASVSFAAEYPESDIVLSNFYKYSGDANELQNKQAEYGKSYYAVIYEGKGAYSDENGNKKIDNGDKWTVTYDTISNYKAVEKLKVKAEFEMGEDLVESVSIVKKNFDGSGFAPVLADAVAQGAAATYGTDSWGALAGGTPYGPAEAAPKNTFGVNSTYVYCVEIKTKATGSIGDADIVGTFEFNRKAKDGIAKIDGVERDFALNLWYENAYATATGTATAYTVSDEVDLKWDDKYVLKFDSDDEITINFGDDDLNEGEFTVDVSGQGKMVVDFNTKANEAIANANPGVKMFFVSFNGAKFNRTGTFEYEMEDMVAAYKVEGDKLVEINGLEIDGETATFATRTLGNYVFATAELVNPVAEAPVVEAPAAVTNPSTGA